MPWLQYDQEEERDQKHVYLFKEVAKLHSATVRDIQIRTEDISGFYEATKRDWENDKLVYEQFADRAEKEWYLSPFELQAVTYLTETVSAVNFALERLEEWFDAAKDHDKTRAVINHGDLSSRHFLYNDAGSGFSRISRKRAGPSAKRPARLLLQNVQKLSESMPGVSGLVLYVSQIIPAP